MPQVTSKASVDIVATGQRAGHGNNQQPEDHWDARSGEASKVQEKGYEKVSQSHREENGEPTPKERPEITERRL